MVTPPSGLSSRAREAAGRSNSPASEGPERCLLGNRYCSESTGGNAPGASNARDSHSLAVTALRVLTLTRKLPEQKNPRRIEHV